ncbi:MAG: hypothetical protein J5830_03790 [Clostridia bacterium]|nr:hypothetical protein [Clostridia bacterium]
MEKAISYLKRNMTLALRSLRYNGRRYIPFFIAVVISQLCFGVLFVVNGFAAREEKRIAANEYDYHVEYYGMTESQVAYLHNYSSAVSKGAIYTVVEALPSGTVDGEEVYNVRILLKKDIETNFKQFRRGVLATALSFGNDSVSYYLTPLYTGVKSGNNALTLRLMLIFSAVTLLLLTALYIVRINNFRFEYGIYMTCGADFRKLTEGSAFEMLLIVAVCYLPSMAVSTAVSSLLCGGFAVARPVGWLLTLLLTALISFLSVIFPMFVTSRIYPVKNISAADNSNYAASPRRSAELLGCGTGKYQRLSFVRFRKYFLRATAAAASFAVCASVLYYTSFIARAENDAPGAQFTLTFRDGTVYDEECSSQLATFPEIGAVNKVMIRNAAVLNTAVAFGKGKILPFADGFVGYSGDGYSKYTDTVDFSPTDPEVINWLSRYSCDGDLSLALSEGWCIVVQNRFNRRVMNVKPGDEICIAVAGEPREGTKVTKSELDLLTGEKLLQAKLKYYSYSYRTLKVAAVLKDVPTFEMIPLYLSESDWRDIAGAGEYTRVELYCDESADIEKLDRELREWASIYGGITVKNTHYAAEKEIEQAQHRPQMLAALGILTAVAAPVLWFFSETVFYGKRRDEFLILSWFGGTDREVRRIHISDACAFAAISTAFTAVFSAIGIAVSYRIANFIAGESLYHTFRFPTALYLIMLLLTAVGSAAAVITSYFALRRSSAAGDLTDDN